MSINFENCTFSTKWSVEDQEYVGLCNQFPSLSWLDPIESQALSGIKKLVRDCLQDINNSTDICTGCKG